MMNCVIQGLITERRLALGKASEQHLNYIANNMHFAVVHIDQDFKICHVAGAYAATLELDEHAIGRPLNLSSTMLTNQGLMTTCHDVHAEQKSSSYSWQTSTGDHLIARVYPSEIQGVSALLHIQSERK